MKKEQEDIIMNLNWGSILLFAEQVGFYGEVVLKHVEITGANFAKGLIEYCKDITITEEQIALLERLNLKNYFLRED